MNISKDEQRAALQEYVRDRLSPKPLRYMFGFSIAVTMVAAIAGSLLPSPRLGQAANVGAAAVMVLAACWVVRARLLVRRVDREPREFAVGAVAVALRRAGVDDPRQVRAAMIGGPWDGDVVPLVLPGSGPWPGSLCPTVAGVPQHYRLEHVGGDTTATYLYLGECVSGAHDG